MFALQRAKRETWPAGGKAALVATQLLLAALFYTNVVFDHTASAFAWQIFAVSLAALGDWPLQMHPNAPAEVLESSASPPVIASTLSR